MTRNTEGERLRILATLPRARSIRQLVRGCARFPRTRSSCGSLLLLLCAFLPVQAALAGVFLQGAADRDMQEGFAAMERLEWDAAAASFERATQAPDAPPESFFYLGLARWRGGHLVDADAALQRATEVTPDRPRPFLFLGMVRFARRRLAEAREPLLRAAALDPENALVHLFLGRLYLNLVQFDRAEMELDRALHLDPDNADVWTNRGLLDYRKGELVSAYKALSRALVLDPENREAHLLLSEVALQQGSLRVAEEQARQLLELDPSEARVYYLLAEVLSAAGRSEESEAERREYKKIQQAEDLKSEAAMAAGRQGDIAAADPVDLLRREPAVGLLEEAEEARRQGWFGEAASLARTAGSLDPGLASAAQRVLALVAYDQGEYRQAATMFEGLWDQGQHSVNIAHDLALALVRAEESSRAAEFLRQALDDSSWEGARDAGIFYLLALARLQSAHPKAAVDAVLQAIALDADVARSYLVLSQAYQRLGRIEEARRARRRYEALKGR
ncbi:MAG: tetratricopeptide repeat protein [Acidobacteriota bacterium]